MTPVIFLSWVVGTVMYLTLGVLFVRWLLKDPAMTGTGLGLCFYLTLMWPFLAVICIIYETLIRLSVFPKTFRKIYGLPPKRER